MDTPDRKLSATIQKCNGRLTIIGQGYVGFPLAVAFDTAGFTVAGVDTDPDRVASLNLGHPPTPDVPATTLERCSPTATTGRRRTSPSWSRATS
jgi:UDP-N-acetyl-D-mannosaminuronate dehydrogenase